MVRKQCWFNTILIAVSLTIFQTGCAGFNPLARWSNSGTVPLFASKRIPDPQRKNTTSTEIESQEEKSTKLAWKNRPKFPQLTNTPLRNKLTAVFNKNKAGVEDESLTFSKTKITSVSNISSIDDQTNRPSADLNPLIQTARLHEHRGETGKAAEFYRQVLAVAPEQLTALIGYGRLLDRENKFAEAATYYQRATQAHPDNPSAFNDLGLCLARQGNLKSSIKTLSRAVELRPRSELYRNNIAAVLVENNQPDHGMEHLAEVHGEAIAHYNIAYLLQKRGQMELAKDHFTLALKCDPSLEPARQMLTRMEPSAGNKTMEKRLLGPPGIADSFSQPCQTVIKRCQLQLPQRVLPGPQQESLENPPLPHGGSFLYSDSIQQLSRADG